MKGNKLTIRIDRSAPEGFAFALNPKNTPKWIDDLVSEETNEWPVKIGTIYKNVNRAGERHEYIVSAWKENEMFEFISKDGNYHVRYTYRPISDNSFDLEYLEWVDEGELEEPFTLDILEKLKAVMQETI